MSVHLWPDGILASLLAVGLFLFWTAVGCAVLSWLKTGLEGGRRLLAAPAVGAATSLLPIFWVNWWGVPVGLFARPLFAGITAMALAALWIRPAHVPRREAWYAAMPLAAVFLLNGWPLLTNGFAWLSYANDDMATYCLMAQRVIEHGLVEPPSAAVLRASSDLSSNMWLLDLAFARAGTHLLIAWVASSVGRSVVDVYMPTLIAMHLALVASAGAMVWRRPADRPAAYVVCWLLAASALTALGTVTQLLPQVFGLALGCAFVTLIWDIDQTPFGIGPALAIAITGASLLVVYPEFTPFVAVPLLARLVALRLWRRDQRRTLGTLGTVAGAALLFVAPYADRFIPFLLQQVVHGVGGPTSAFELFPYFRLSTTFANLWGLLPIARPVPEPLLSIAIAVGASGFAWLCVALVRPLRRGESAPAVLLFMLLFSGFLFARGSGFGLFKIAMYAQPFMLGTVALVLARSAGGARSRSRWLAIVLVALLGLPSQAFYLASSVNPSHARTEIQNQPGAMNDLRGLRDFRGSSLDVDLPVTVTAKLAALFVRDVPLRFVGMHEIFRPRVAPSVVSTRFLPEASALSAVVANVTGRRREFSLRDPTQPSKSDPFYLAERPAADGSAAPACESVLTTTTIQSVVNRTTTGMAGGSFRLLPCGEITNHLAFVSSELGRNYYLAGVDPIALFGLERDYFFPDRTFAGVGRYLLFEVLRPTPTSRLVLDFTSSLKSDGANLLPPVDVVGEQRVSLHALGHGSARLYSDAVAPQWIDGHAYLAIDFGADGTRYPDRRRGLMTWLGRDIAIDPRQMVGLARNISLVSEAAYERMTPPTQIERFPNDLAGPAIEYSGIYEDGWVADHSLVVLRRSTGAGVVTVKGMLLPTPSGSGTTVSVDIDGVAIRSEHHDPGTFAIDVDVPAAKRDRVAVGLRFSQVRPLSDEDRRPASAHLDYVGVTR